MSSSLVRKANKAPSAQLLLSLGSTIPNAYTFKVARAKELSDHERDSIWAIFNENMRDLYSRSSFGWNPASKLAELFDPLSRFILVHEEAGMVAFTMFRFEYEDGENILYCYDLQISRTCQRTGLGKALMQSLEQIGTGWRMGKIVLTVFKGNRSARDFYSASGFEVDESSPGYTEDGEDPVEEEEVDYEILSKPLQVEQLL
ncbi:N-alpha-acetyltransferase 40 [Hypsizygus marmoreus]|uniref:N-alpha-acetyltransferase 40 n=1 Tax=Hypsizygus marmoreus TaxID=39966 RepID=A0A369KAC2_HYPMA|nr:N-alpha-acetyltransferase 40 [Hypsizygus marmoreus]